MVAFITSCPRRISAYELGAPGTNRRGRGGTHLNSSLCVEEADCLLPVGGGGAAARTRPKRPRDETRLRGWLRAVGRKAREILGEQVDALFCSVQHSERKEDGPGEEQGERRGWRAK